MKFLTLATLLLTGSLLTTANANTITVYESTGKHGEKRFSQIPPNDTKDYTLREFRRDGRIADTGRMASLPEQAVPPAPNPDAQRADEAEKALKEQRAKELAERCKTMRTNLAAFSTGGRIYETNDKGERVYLNDQEISSKKQRTQDAINKECS